MYGHRVYICSLVNSLGIICFVVEHLNIIERIVDITPTQKLDEMGEQYGGQLPFMSPGPGVRARCSPKI